VVVIWERELGIPALPRDRESRRWIIYTDREINETRGENRGKDGRQEREVIADWKRII
jgi:hypothetical protein